MARFDLYEKKNSAGYWLDIQTGYLDVFETRAVIPIEPLTSDLRLVSKLNPIFDISGIPHVLHTQLIGNIPARDLNKPVGSLADRHYEILNAVDFLVGGF